MGALLRRAPFHGRRPCANRAVFPGVSVPHLRAVLCRWMAAGLSESAAARCAHALAACVRTDSLAPGIRGGADHHGREDRTARPYLHGGVFDLRVGLYHLHGDHHVLTYSLTGKANYEVLLPASAALDGHRGSHRDWFRTNRVARRA